ncbi:MAG: hypothetical protein HY903_03630 [Deltaproteobacteria bacterium]|nr:hypothetical protein [Deltaproteobacteria bacterium]
MRRIGLAVWVTGLAACAHSYIAGTQIPDTSDNREIYKILATMRAALEAKDDKAILAVVSKRYFEDNGTTEQTDDYGYDELANKVLPESLGAAKELYVTFEVHDIAVEGEKAHADIRYASRARLELPSGTLWDSHREFNRVELAREGERWMVVSGL